jgi:hypothetical protein
MQGESRKRHVMVDTDGRGLILLPQPADVQDRDGAPIILRLSRRSFPFIAKAFADMGFAGFGPETAPGGRCWAPRPGRSCRGRCDPMTRVGPRNQPRS